MGNILSGDPATDTFTIDTAPLPEQLTHWFPFEVKVPPDVRIVLHADGKWEGSMPADLIEAMGGARNYHETDPVKVCLLWLLLREMQRDVA